MKLDLRTVAAALAFTGVGFAVSGAAAADALNICVVHNNADHPSITAIVKGMDDEGAIYGVEYHLFRPGLRSAEAGLDGGGLHRA